MFARTSSSSSTQLVCALAEALGQPVDIDDNDECVLEFEGLVDVVLAQTVNSQVLSLRSAISQASPLEPQLMQWALALNFTSMLPGCAIAFDDAEKQLALVALIDADHVSPDHFLSLLAGFVAMVPQLREQCETLAEHPDPAAGYPGEVA
ncbi:MAG: type III secretion system chaperone [Ramlibacter sp.]|nr:type III secretion system chaperone [Ramlibacter sp.]